MFVFLLKLCLSHYAKKTTSCFSECNEIVNSQSDKQRKRSIMAATSFSARSECLHGFFFFHVASKFKQKLRMKSYNRQLKFFFFFDLFLEVRDFFVQKQINVQKMKNISLFKMTKLKLLNWQISILL